jgi:hypothetical protein
MSADGVSEAVYSYWQHRICVVCHCNEGNDQWCGLDLGTAINV